MADVCGLGKLETGNTQNSHFSGNKIPGEYTRFTVFYTRSLFRLNVVEVMPCMLNLNASNLLKDVTFKKEMDVICSFGCNSQPFLTVAMYR